MTLSSAAHHELGLNLVLKELVAHLEECRGGEQAVRASLMLRSYPRNLRDVASLAGWFSLRREG